MSGETASPPLVADPQDPLPESNWLWRRLLVFLVLAFIGWQQLMVGNRIARWGDAGAHGDAIDALLTMTRWHIGTLAIVLVLYLIAPSAEQFAKIVQTVSAWKSGIATSVSAKVATAQGTAETRTAAGPAQAAADLPDERPDYAR